MLGIGNGISEDTWSSIKNSPEYKFLIKEASQMVMQRAINKARCGKKTRFSTPVKRERISVRNGFLLLGDATFYNGLMN
jgi:hypothetical protein